MDLQPVVSSNIVAIGFDGKMMYVKFTNGQIYETSGATQADYDAWKAAKSKGVHFAKILKKAFVWSKIEKKS